MSITYNEFTQKLEEANAVMVDYEALSFPSVDHDERYFDIHWESNGNLIENTFYEDQIKSITYDESTKGFTLTTVYGSQYVIHLLAIY